MLFGKTNGTWRFALQFAGGSFKLDFFLALCQLPKVWVVVQGAHVPQHTFLKPTSLKVFRHACDPGYGVIKMELSHVLKEMTR